MIPLNRDFFSTVNNQSLNVFLIKSRYSIDPTLMCMHVLSPNHCILLKYISSWFMAQWGLQLLHVLYKCNSVPFVTKVYQIGRIGSSLKVTSKSGNFKNLCYEMSTSFAMIRYVDLNIAKHEIVKYTLHADARHFTHKHPPKYSIQQHKPNISALRWPNTETENE